ncbi:hypothetical protein [Capnocytophaga leadbetteri]|uniref:hypothetical protein n=1 Tax=Capnocytophaga leadbetteri TaxID=327575 RepID=UPI0028F07A6D|nr:hypothetical protein [Capnocytophaga leadbetteri]
MKSRFLEYTEALSLDTFLQILTFEQRLQTCQYRAGHTDRVPALVQKLQDWCKQHHWQPPAFRYEANSLELLWQDSTTQWLPLAVHPLYQAEVTGY